MRMDLDRVISGGREAKHPRLLTKLSLSSSSSYIHYSQLFFLILILLLSSWAGVLQAGLTRTLNVLGRKSKALKEGEANLAGDHIREGLTCVVAVKVRLIWHAPSPANTPLQSQAPGPANVDLNAPSCVVILDIFD